MDNICRTCLKVTNESTNIFTDTLLPYKIKIISSVEVCVDDNLPSSICELCERNVHLLYDFRNIIIRSNKTLLKKKNELESSEIIPPEIKETDINYFDIDIKPNISDLQIIENEITELQKPYVKQAINNANKQKIRGKSTSSESKLGIHQENGSKCLSRKSICNICGVSIRSDNLKKHILIHTEEPVKCVKCGKSCKNSESLRSHMIMHKGLVYECKMCGKTYKHRGGLTAHKKRHAAGDVKTVPCSLCGKLFFDKQVLQKHIRSHTGERPYPCKYCNKGFSSIYARNTHTRQHTNERPYACQFCTIAFPQKVSLKTHLQSKHPEEIDALNSL